MVEDEGEDGEDELVEQFADVFCSVGPQDFGSSLLFDRGSCQFGDEVCLVYLM